MTGVPEGSTGSSFYGESGNQTCHPGLQGIGLTPTPQCLKSSMHNVLFVCLFDLILYVPSTIFQLYRDGSSWVEPVLS